MQSVDFTRLPVTHRQTIPHDYLDEMGHMNVMWYTHLFDRGVDGIFQLLGMDHDYMEANQAGGFALESYIRYVSEVRVGQEVAVRTRLLGRTEKRFHLMHFMLNESQGVLASTFEVIGAHIDMKLRRMSPFPPQIADKLDELYDQHRALDWEAPLCGVMGP